MSLLDSLINMKQQQEAQANADAAAIPAAVNSFIVGRQQAKKDMIDELTMKGNLAAHGLSIQGNDVIRDPNLVNPKDVLSSQLNSAKLQNYQLTNQIMESMLPGKTQEGGNSGQSGYGAYLNGFSSSGPKIAFDSPVDVANRGTQLRKELQDQPIIKRFNDLNNFNSGIDIALKDALAAGKDQRAKNTADQAIITLFNKMLDPTSVVREGEYSRTEQGQSLLNQIKASVEQLKSGGAKITDEQRKDMSRVAKKILDATGGQYNQILDQYSGLSDQLKVPKEQVLGSLKRYASSAAPSFKVGDERVVGGKTYSRGDDGQWRLKAA